MSFTVNCTCGKQHTVAPTQAGSTLVCSCGRNVLIPRLSQLRQSAGLAAFESSTIDEIERLKSEGKLPPDRMCMLSGWPTENVVEVCVQCEGKWIRGPSQSRGLFFALAFFLLPFWWIWAIFAHDELSKKYEELGRDRIVYMPLRIAREHHAKLRRLGQRRLRRILRSVPIYAQLLAEYPHARIFVPS